MPKHLIWLAAPLAQALLLLAPSEPARASGPGDKPDFIIGEVVSTHYDGVSDDLLTAGLGSRGLGSATAPPVSTPPSAEDLRRLAIWNNYRALIDPTPGGGYGLLYGPTVTADGQVLNPRGTVPGWEALALARAEGRGRRGDPSNTITVMVQIPGDYDKAHGCIITAPSSGSRGIYGAIATAGEWGLKHGCAVAYTDKGTGTGAHDLHADTVNLLRGERVDANAAGKEFEFHRAHHRSRAPRVRPGLPVPVRVQARPLGGERRRRLGHERAALDPVRVLRAEPAAFRRAARRINKRNTLVIASSVSNGGGASLRAVEQDGRHLIDGVAV